MLWCDEFGHFAQDCPQKIPPSGMPYHHGRSCSRHGHTHNWRTDHTPNNGSRYRRYISRSQPLPHSHCNRSNSFRKAHLMLFFQPLQQLTVPLSHWMLPLPLMCDANWHSHTPSWTHHFSQWVPLIVTPQTTASLTQAASTTQHKYLSPGKSSSAQDPLLCINPTAPKLSPSRIPLQTPCQILTMTDPLN